jgi:hypothetical protein
MPEPAAKKYAGKYESPEALEQAYLEAQKALGGHGQELGTLREQLQAREQALQEYANYVTQMNPVVGWYRQNLNVIKPWWEGRQKAAAQPQPVGVPQGWETLNPAQQFQVMVRAAGQHAQSIAQRLLAEQGQAYAKKVQQDLENQYKHSVNVLWRTFERVIPTDKLEEAKRFHEESLRYADPTKLDPMDLANDTLALRSERDRLKSEAEELRKEKAARDKAAIGSLGPAPSVRSFERPKADAEKPDKAERMRAAFGAVEKEHGAEGLNALLGPAPAGGGR